MLVDAAPCKERGQKAKIVLLVALLLPLFSCLVSFILLIITLSYEFGGFKV